MAYVKNIWVDQDVERPKTYEVTNNEDGSITLTDSFGIVTELGTPVNEVNMNHIEDGIDGCAIRKHNLTETFNLGEWVLGGTGDDEGIYKSLVSNNVGNAITNTAKWEKVEMGGNSRNIGEIVASTIPLTDAGLHLLDGTLLSGSGSYADFVTYIAGLRSSYSSLFTTESAWQTSVTNYGVCGKFVYNSTNNTVRLPKITGFTENASSIANIGDVTAAGLPNITGTVFPVRSTGGDNTGLGAFASGTSHSGEISTVSSGTSYSISFDASNSNAIYGNSNTVQPQSVKVLYYIVIATTTKTDIEVDIDEIVTDLNGKADVDLTNVNDSGTSRGGSWALPSNTYTNLTLGASGTSYTAPANGWYVLGKTVGTSNKFINMVNETSGIASNNNSNATSHICRIFIPCLKGDTISVTYDMTGSTEYFRFIYAQGSESEA